MGVLGRAARPAVRCVTSCGPYCAQLHNSLRSRRLCDSPCRGCGRHQTNHCLALSPGRLGSIVLDIRDVDPRRRQPLQRLGYIAGPDAPSGTVSEFHHMAPIVLFDLRRRSPCDRSEPWMSQRRKEAGPPERLLERLSGRGTDALTNFFANLGIVLRHLQNRVVRPRPPSGRRLSQPRS